MIRRILVPTDCSRTANEAVGVAADLAVRHEAALILLHVGAHGRALPAELQHGTQEALAHRLEEQERREQETGDPAALPGQAAVVGRIILDEASQLAIRRGATRVETILDYGDVTERILHYAVQQGADMIAMGSRGQGDLAGLLLGSVSNKVQHHAPCTTLVVHDPERGEHPVLRSVLVAVDGSPDASKALDLASDIAAKAGARLVVLHALLHDALPERVSEQINTSALSDGAREQLERGATQAEALRYEALPVPHLSAEVLTEVGHAVLERSCARAAAAGVPEVVPVLLDQDPAAAIVAEAERQASDLIVLGSRGFGTLAALLLGSVSHKVSRLAACPSIVVR